MKKVVDICKNLMYNILVNVTEYEMQDKFINENMDVLHKYLLWKETILPAQVLDDSVKIEAEEVETIVIQDNGEIN